MGQIAAMRREEGWAKVLFPKKSGGKTRQARSEESPKAKQIAFRPPPDILEYIESVERLGYSKTEAVLRLLYVAKDAVVALGPLWWDVERKAHLENTSPGKVLADLVSSALKAKK